MILVAYGFSDRKSCFHILGFLAFIVQLHCVAQITFLKEISARISVMKPDYREKLKAILGLFSIAVLLVVSTKVQGACSFTQSCGGGHGSNTHKFSNKSACDRKRKSTKSAIKRQGGGCSFSSCSCTGGSKSISTDKGNFNTNLQNAIQNSVQDAVSDFFKGSDNKKTAAIQRALEKRRRLERETIQKQRRIKACETSKAQQIQFRQDQADVLGQIKGVDSHQLAAKDIGSDVAMGGLKMDFDTYVDDQTTRRNALKLIKQNKKLHDWCLLHAPLRPQAATADFDCKYEMAMDRYVERQNRWEEKCQLSLELKVKDLTTRSDNCQKCELLRVNTNQACLNQLKLSSAGLKYAKCSNDTIREWFICKDQLKCWGLQ